MVVTVTHHCHWTLLLRLVKSLNDLLLSNLLEKCVGLLNNYHSVKYLESVRSIFNSSTFFGLCGGDTKTSFDDIPEYPAFYWRWPTVLHLD
jgi:hypothetical protein